MAKRNKYILLDRDGVINQERGTHTFLPEDFKWVNGLWQGLKQLQLAGYQFVVLTNQSGISQGKYGHEEVAVLNQLIFEKAKQEGIKIQEIFYCPHHPNQTLCLCRKPGSLLFEKAIAKYQIDVNQSWMIGDKDRDIAPAKKMGIHGLLVKANSNFVANIQPIFVHG